MIQSDTFVWLHFPKCAGMKIESLFTKYYSNDTRITQDPVNVRFDPSVSWHDSLGRRAARDPQFALGTRVLICSFRRLPSWLESRYSFEYQRTPGLDHHPERLLEGKFLEQGGTENHADAYARLFLPPPILASHEVRFIRTEHFEADFKAVFAEHVDVSIIPDREFSKKVNTSRSSLSADIRTRLYDDQHELYEKCPYWTSVERLAYGSTP